MESWKAGATPSRSNRQLIERELAIPASAWQQPPTAFEQEFAAQLARTLGSAFREAHAALQGAHQ